MFNWIKGIIATLAGKEVGGQVGTSKTKIIAILGIIFTAIQTIPPAFGHAPIVIPDWVYKLLAAAGLWTVRDAIKS